MSHWVDKEMEIWRRAQKIAWAIVLTDEERASCKAIAEQEYNLAESHKLKAEKPLDLTLTKKIDA